MRRITIGTCPPFQGSSRYRPYLASHTSHLASQRYSATLLLNDNDCCRVIIRLGPPSNILTGFDIDTANFTGNEGPAADVWGLKLDGDDVEKQEKGLEGDDPRVSGATILPSLEIEIVGSRS